MDTRTSHLQPRSTKGCWICRLRRKKCDECRPCLRCASVNVACNYGPKPKWFDDIGLAKEELERIKLVVKESANRKRAALRSKAAKKSMDIPSPISRRQITVQSLLDNSEDGGPTPAESPRRGNESKSLLFPKWAEDQEANLMMHYLDQVFYIQFRFYTPSISFGGRGWLLSLLNRTKPLYHAALSLSAFHRQALLLDQGDRVQNGYLQELETHHNLALKELQHFIHAHSENDSAPRVFEGNIQILACMVQLISFEVSQIPQAATHEALIHYSSSMAE